MRTLQQYFLMVRQTLKVELSEPQRFVSPLLFALTILLLFYFSSGNVEGENAATFFVGQTYLSIFLALQLAFTKVFEPDTQDQAFTLMRVYPVKSEAWFLAKLTVVILFAVAVTVVCLLGATLFNERLGLTMISWQHLAVCVLAILGLSSLGVLISAMTQKTDNRQFIYPLIYFPLTVPVLLAATQSSLALFKDGGTLGGLMGSWLGMLLIFDAIYLTLATLLYGELLKPE